MPVRSGSDAPEKLLRPDDHGFTERYEQDDHSFTEQHSEYSETPVYNPEVDFCFYRAMLVHVCSSTVGDDSRQQNCAL